MESKETIKSVLTLDRMVFDKIVFNREGFKNDNDTNFKIQTLISKKQDEEVYRVSLTLTCNKEDEYIIEISLTGFFSFDGKVESEALKEDLINKNAVAILMPYLRSELSLLTAQPETECIVLPPFNINTLMEKAEGEKLE